MDLTPKITRRNVLLGVLTLLLFPSFIGSASYYYLTPLKVIAGNVLPNTGNITRDMNPQITTAFNGGSIADGDAISSYVDQSVNADSYTNTSTKRPTFKTNIVNGKNVFRFAAANQQNLLSSARTLLATNTPFTYYVVFNLSSFDQVYKFISSFKGASAAASPSLGVSTNASFKDFYFGCDGGGWMVWRATTISSIAGNWKYVVIRYNGSGASTIGNYAGSSNGSSLTLTSTTGNDGDATYNVFGGYKSTSSVYNFNGDIAREVLWNVDVGTSGVSQIASYNLATYGF